MTERHKVIGRPKTVDLDDSVMFQAEELCFMFREVIVTELKRRGWNRADLSRASGISSRNVSRILNEHCSSTILSYARLLAELDLPVDIVKRRAD